MGWVTRSNLKGPTGTIDTASAVELPTTADPTVELGGTPAHRDITFGIPRANSVESAAIGGTGRLSLSLTDGSTLDAGVARGPQGVPGFEGVATDEGVAQLVKLPSATQDALLANYASQFTITEETATADIQGWISTPSPLGVKRLLGAHMLASALVPAAGLHVDLTSAVLTLPDGGAGDALVLSADDVTVVGGRLEGNRAGRTGTSRGVLVTGAGVTVRDISISGFRNFGVYGASPDALTLSGIRVTDCGNIGIYIQGLNGVSYGDLTIQHCRVDRVAEGVGIVEGGIKVRGGAGIAPRNVNVSNNVVKLPEGATAAAAIGIEVWDSPGAVVTNNQTEGGSMGLSIIRCDHGTTSLNTCFSASHYGIELGASLAHSVTGNTINGNGITGRGIALTGPNNTYMVGATVTGNTVTGCTARSFYSLNADGLALTANTFTQETANYVVDVQGTNDGTITGNIVNGSGLATKGVVLESCTEVTVTGNTIRGWTQHGVFVYSALAGYLAAYVVIAYNIIRGSGGIDVGSQFTNGAAWGVGSVSIGNLLGRDRLSMADSLLRAFGSGSPEGTVAAGVGSTYHRINGAAGTSLYVKESGGVSNTGWVAK